MAKSKLEKDIDEIINKVDIRRSKLLNCEMLGELMQLMGVYKILYNKMYYPNNNEIKGINQTSKIFELRKEKEHEFHNNFWSFINTSNADSVSSSLIKSLIILFHDSLSVPPSVLCNKMDGMIIYIS